MKKSVLGLAVMVMATLITGCATGKNNGMKNGMVTVVIPEQEKGMMPFFVRKAKYSERFTEGDLAPLTAVSGYLEAIAAASHLPIQVKEGFLFKERGQWYLVARWLERLDQLACVYDRENLVYYIADIKTVNGEIETH